MEWSAKWDWESIAKLSSKACESPKKLQLTDWGIVEEEGEIVNVPFNASGGYASDVGQGSAHSSPEGTTGAKESIFPFVDVKMEENCREACIGLKLGKRTYFENNNCGGGGGGGGNGGKTKKPLSCQGGTTVPRCQVEGCNIDLSSGKEYHRKHRVCESHSKYPKVIVGGLERRFCQQCSRFHSLSEFDEKKRSCRRRLCDHNARRRKPQHDAFQLNTSANRLSPSFYDSRQQINFMMNNVPLFGTSKTASNSSCWENGNTYASNKFITTRGLSPEPEKPTRANKQQQQQQAYISSGIHPQNATIGFHDSFAPNDSILDSKGPTSDGFTQGVKGSMFYMETSMTTEEFPARALSLLSTSSWTSSCEHQQNDTTSISQSAANQTALHEQPLIPLGLPLPSPEYWSCVEPAGGHLPVDVHLEFKVSQDGDFFLNSFS